MYCGVAGSTVSDCANATEPAAASAAAMRRRMCKALIMGGILQYRPPMIDPGSTATVAWWIWPLALFAVCFVLGVFAVPAGVGGGVLFVPIVSAFFPVHLDFVRGPGLLVALAGALSAGPRLVEGGRASLRLARRARLRPS